MKTNLYEQQLAELRSAIARLEQLTPLERLKQALLLTSDAISEIKADVLQNGFATVADEIHFFKFVKPAFYALQIYEVDRYNNITNEPAGPVEMIKSYYETELLYIIRFFRLQPFHYQYFRTGARELDSSYFTRDGKPGDIPILELPEIFPGFSTPLDYVFAKFIAYEQMQTELIDKLTELYSNTKKSSRPLPKLQWTGEAIHLAELAYGIWLTNQINDGKASMAEITRFLEEVFGVHIGDPNRRWQDITRRKTVSPTKFLDQTINEINKRIDNERSLIRKKKS